MNRAPRRQPRKPAEIVPVMVISRGERIFLTAFAVGGLVVVVLLVALVVALLVVG